MQNIAYNFQRELNALVHQECSGVYGTAGVGSMVTLLFGETYIETITLPSFGSFAHEKSERFISLDFAAWRLQDEHQTLCSSCTQNGVGSLMETMLAKLKLANVKQIELAPLSLDLRIRFTGGFMFSIFCDQADLDTTYDNYSVGCKQGIFTVGPASALRFEKYKE